MLAAVGLIACGVAASGCGYSTSSLMPAGVRTISVPVFDNDTFRRSIEVQLTKAVHSEILTRTSLKLTETHLADSILEGTITRVDQPVAAEDERDRITTQDVFVTVKFTWKDLRTGEVIHAVEGLSTSDSIVVPLGQNLELAIERALGKMAEAIVNEMEFRDW